MQEFFNVRGPIEEVFHFLDSARRVERSVLKFDPEKQAPFFSTPFKRRARSAQKASSRQFRHRCRRVGMNYCKLKSVYTMNQNKRSAAPAAALFYFIIVACCEAKKLLALSCFLNVGTLKYITLQETLPRLSYNPINSTRAKLISEQERPSIKICAPCCESAVARTSCRVFVT